MERTGMDLAQIIEDETVELLRLAVIKLPEDVKQALKNACDGERTEAGKMQLRAILENIQLAEKTGTPMCQDTGLIIFFVKVGDKFCPTAQILEAITRGTRRATREIPLRPNAVHPLSRRNSGDNTGVNIPYVNWEIASGDFMEITALPKGAGSENWSSVAMVSPGEGVSAVKRYVVDTVVRAGGQPCPPTVIGVGLGGSADAALKLAKRALLRPVGKHHPEPDIAKLEQELLDLVNMTGVGPMGLGGKYTALAVNVEYAYCHTASLPVGINIQCWADRRATARIDESGRVQYLS